MAREQRIAKLKKLYAAAGLIFILIVAVYIYWLINFIKILQDLAAVKIY
jgi:hypothetical protein